MTRRRLLGLLRCLRDDRGTGVIEMAVILPLIAIFLVNIIDVSAVVVHKITLQKAVNSSLEMALVKEYKPDTESDADMAELKAEAARLAGVEESYVTTDKWLECDGEEQQEFTGECDPDQVIARYVQIRIADWYVPLFSMSAIGLKGDQFALYAEGALRIQ